MKKITDPIAEYRRSLVARRRVGDGARCRCGETRPQVLRCRSGEYVCEECWRTKIRRSTFDGHHPAGKSNCSIKIPIPANDHIARLSVEQYSWPPTTLRNRDRSPLLAAAACIRGFIETVVYLLDRLLGWIPPILEEVDEGLTGLLGRRWWKRILRKNSTSKH